MTKAVVFGGSGFVGSHVVDELTSRGYDVVVFDREKSEFLHDSQKMIVGDILDLEKVKAAIKGCDFVYNFAAIADITTAANRPLDTIKVNLMGHANVLEACRESKPKRIVVASTLYVYSDRGSFYKASKQMAELLTEEYSKTYGLEFTMLRYGSLYGPRSSDWNGMYAFLKKGLKEKVLEYPGTGEERREYIHIYDAAKLSVDIIESKDYANQSVIITGAQPYTIKEVFTMIREILGDDIKIKFGKGFLPGHYKITPYTFRPKFAKKLLVNPSVDLAQGILEMVHDMEREINKDMDEHYEIVSSIPARISKDRKKQGKK